MGSKIALATFCSTLALTATAANADEVLLKSGDRITGKILSAAGGSLVVTPDFAKGTNLTIALSDIATFSTSAPLTIKLKDGSEIHQAVDTAAAGEITLAKGGALAPQPVPVAAIDKINPEAVTWHGALGVNGMAAQAATDTRQIGVSVDGVRRSDTDRISFNAAYSYGEQSTAGVSTTNAENWAAGLKYDYFVAPKWYAFASVSAAGDHVNHLQLRFTPSIGGGYQWIDKGSFHLSTEFGASWIYEDYSTLPSATNNAALRLAYHVDKTLVSGRVSLFHDLEYIPSVQDGSEFLVNTDAGMRVSLTANMFSEIKAKLAYDNQPPVGTKSATSELRIGVGMTY